MLYYTILYYTTLYYTILYYTILYYTILYYTMLYYTILFLRSVLRLIVIASTAPSSATHVTLVMEALRSSETSVLTRATRRNVPENGIPHSHCRENLKSYITLTGGLCSGDIMCFLLGTKWILISETTAIFIVTAVKTSDLAKDIFG
jgi:hypothetical protein